MPDLRADALAILNAALAAVDPATAVRRALGRLSGELDAARRILVLGAGKAAAPMAQAVEEILGDRVSAGWINTKYGHGAPLQRIACNESGHPIPDAQGVEGALRVADLARSATASDLVLVLLSGGASALLPLPAEGLALEEKRETTRLLLASGATIHEINAVRKHLSRIKGGRLAQLAAPAPVITLILSDVVGDDLDTIASGPTAPDASTFAEAREILARRHIWDQIPIPARELLESARAETPKPGDPLFTRVQNIIVGDNRQALAAAQEKARALGFTTLLLASTIQGETSDVARLHAAILREIDASGNPVQPPACILSGGETTVTMLSGGKGGRNQEFALAAALDAAGLENVLILSAGTDGTDGPTDAAGAFADGSTVERARAAGFDAAAHLRAHDAYPLFSALGDLLLTGPTRTNVMDIHVLLAGPRSG